jgi:hypothetical protein
VPDIALGSAELRLIGLDDGVRVEQVELAGWKPYSVPYAASGISIPPGGGCW